MTMKTINLFFWVLFTISVARSSQNFTIKDNNGNGIYSDRDYLKRYMPTKGAAGDTECLNNVKSEYEEDDDGSDGPETRIMNGEVVDIEKYPYQVAISTHGGFRCGGTIIKEKIVITAAHCLQATSDPKHYTVRAGISNLNEEGQLRNAAQIFIPKKYSVETGLEFDVGIIVLEKPFDFNAKVGSLKLPDDDICYKPGDSVNVTGFGRSSKDQNVHNSELRAITSKLISAEECKKFWAPLAHSSFCTTSAEGKGICFGDSGGPVAWNGYLIGVTSFLIGECGGEAPNGFKSIPYFLKWIHKKIDGIN